jgi:hypothetical protein
VTSRALAHTGHLKPSFEAGAVRRYVTAERLRHALAATLLVAAGVHVVVGAQHLPSIFGDLAILSGIAQLGLAVAVMIRPSAAVYGIAVVTCLVLVQLYVVNVTLGLPLVIAHTHSAGTHQLWGATLASPAPIDGEGVLAKIAELSAVAFAGLLGRAGR